MGEIATRKLINIIKEIAFFGINFSIKFIYLIFCSIFPLKKTIFVNHFDGNMFGDNPKYILLELFKRNLNIEVYWLAKKDSHINYSNIHYVRPYSLKAIYWQAVSSIWISTVRLPYYSIKRKEQLYIQTWHGGFGFKKVEKECESLLSPRYIRTAKHDSYMIDYYISNNKDNTKLFKDSFWYQTGEILEVGSPRNDIFFCKNKQFFKEKYKLRNKKIALYAPTFRADNSFESYDVDLYRLKTALERRFGGEWVILVRLHPRLENISEKFIVYDENIINASSLEDIQEILVITDFLITDYSSIVFDYIHTRNPAVLYASDIEEYKKDRNFHMRLEESPFTITTNNEELLEYINKFDFDDYNRKLADFNSRVCLFDNGQASSRIADIIQKKILQDI